MAEQGFSGTWIAKGVHQTTWANLTSGNTAAPQSGLYLNKGTIFITGALGSATVLIQGSNAPTATGTFYTLTDSNGNALSFTATGTDEILERPRWVKPTWGASTSPDFTVILIQSGGITR